MQLKKQILRKKRDYISEFFYGVDAVVAETQTRLTSKETLAPTTTTTNKCATVRCGFGYTCNPDTGGCVRTTRTLTKSTIASIKPTTEYIAPPNILQEAAVPTTKTTSSTSPTGGITVNVIEQKDDAVVLPSPSYGGGGGGGISGLSEVTDNTADSQQAGLSKVRYLPIILVGLGLLSMFYKKGQ